jgi:hypothetical protein
MNKKLLLYAPFALASLHFEIALEIAEKYLTKGYSVTLLVCSGELSACALNPYHYQYKCRLCRSRKSSGIKWIGPDRITVKDFYSLTSKQQKYIEEIEDISISSLEVLEKITIDGSDIGMSALRSVIFSLNEPCPDIHKHRDLITRYLVAATTVHFSIKNHLVEQKPDEFILFNGSFAAMRPALRIARNLNIETYVHELADAPGRYSLTKNAYPHHLDVLKQEIKKFYDSSSLTESAKHEIARKWYSHRFNRNVPSWWFDFTRNQQAGLLPNIFSQEHSSKYVKVGIFNSSEGEFTTIAEYTNPFYKDQNQGIYQILKDLKSQNCLKFFLRVHPNLSKSDNSQTRFLEILDREFGDQKSGNLEVIPASSSISTYDLIDACDLVLTFGSTVGIEAVYRGKPSILMGKALYEDLGCVITPNSHEDLIEILNHYAIFRSLPKAYSLPDTQTLEIATIKYGFFFKQWGYPLEYVKFHSLDKASLWRNNKQYFVMPSLRAFALSVVPRVIIKLRKLIAKYLHLNH